MSVKYALLALLGQRPMYGYQLKSEFEARLGQAWPLNIGQVYTTLNRLVRDDLVTTDPAETKAKTETKAEAGPGDQDDRRTYHITPAGRTELTRWFSTPVARNGQHRDELLVKVITALDGGPEAAARVIRTQRTATVELLQRHTLSKAAATQRGDLARLFAADLLIAQAEGEAAWLDLCEARLARRDGGDHPSDPDHPHRGTRRGARKEADT